MIPGNANPLLLASAADAAAAAVATKSLRFNDGDSAYLSRTPSSAGNRKTFTIAFWAKRTEPSTASKGIISARSSGNGDFIRFSDDGPNNLRIYGDGSYDIQTTRVFRDVSAWYHFVIAFDTTQATAADRIKLYINGVEEENLSSTSYPSQNADTRWNSTIQHDVGRVQGTTYMDGYLCDIFMIDGSQLDPTSFGAFDDSGVWQAAAYSGTYGTNGFHLDFADGSDLGDDNSGNGNDFTANNLTGTQNQRFSSGANATGGFESSNPAANGFNGTLTSGDRANGVTVGGTIEIKFNPPITVSSTVGIWSGKSGFKYQINDSGSYTSVTDATEQWHDASFSGTLTNLKIQHTASNEAPGFSGIRVDGTTLIDGTPENLDLLFDVPTNGTQTDNGYGGEVSGNYCTMNPLDNDGNTLSDGNLKIVTSSSAATSTLGTIGVSSGKWYYEVQATTVSGTYWLLAGFSTENDGNSSGAYLFQNDGTKYNNGSSSSYGSSLSVNDVLGVAFNADDGEIAFYINGVSQGTAFTSIPAGTYLPLLGEAGGAANSTMVANFGQRPFAVAAPSGFKPLNTASLPTATIADGSAQFEAVKYTGNGSSNTVTGTEFTPDLVWLKSRSGAHNHFLHDAVRGGTKALYSDLTNSEYDYSPSGVTAFNSDGFTVNGAYAANYSSASLIAWAWNAGANSNKTYTVTVVSDSGNKYRFDGHGTSAVTLDLAEGSTYVFDQSDSSNSGHPLRFSTTSDGTHGGGSEYTTGVTATGTPGSAGAKTTIVVGSGVATLYYYCSSHSGMGGQANTNSTAGSTRLSSSENASFYNQDQDWSDGATGTTNGGADISNLFDGSLSTGVNSTWGNASHKLEYTFTALSHTTIEMYVVGQNVNNSYVKFNGVAQQNGQSSVPFGWYTVTGVTGDLTSIEVYTHSSSDFLTIYAVRVDGKILVDSDKSLSSLTQYPSINSVVKANPEAGFSIVSYTATGSDLTVAHGLNAKPSFIILKSRNVTGDWLTMASALGETDFMKLNKTNANSENAANVFLSTTNSTFETGDDAGINSSGQNKIAYCFAPVAGYSAFGTYTGNGSTDGPFVHTGFRPAIIIQKRTDSTGSWTLVDTARDIDNPAALELLPNSSAAEYDNTSLFDILSNGFKVRATFNNLNASGGSFIYIAFASNPFSANGGLAR